MTVWKAVASLTLVLVQYAVAIELAVRMGRWAAWAWLGLLVVVLGLYKATEAK